MHELGVPAWVSQRLWLGSILFGAALGVLFLLRTLHVRGPGVAVAAVRVHAHAVHARLRGAHLGDPAAVGGAAVDARAHDPRAAHADGKRGAWKYAAIFAIVVQIVGGVNATALVFVGHRAGAVDRLRGGDRARSTWRRALGVTARIGRAHAGHVVVVDRRACGRRAATGSTS